MTFDCAWLLQNEIPLLRLLRPPREKRGERKYHSVSSSKREKKERVWPFVCVVDFLSPVLRRTARQRLKEKDFFVAGLFLCFSCEGKTSVALSPSV